MSAALRNRLRRVEKELAVREAASEGQLLQIQKAALASLSDGDLRYLRVGGSPTEPAPAASYRTACEAAAVRFTGRSCPARELENGQSLRLGRGEERSGGRSKVALLVDSLEAVIAALFLDAGLEVAQHFIQQSILEPGLAEVHQDGSSKLPVIDYKSALQEAVHASGRSQPRYVLIKEEGPDHRKVFTMEAQVPAAPNGDKGFARRAEGNTKKLAEQRAAREAWDFLQSLERVSGTPDNDTSSKPSEPS